LRFAAEHEGLQGPRRVPLPIPFKGEGSTQESPENGPMHGERDMSGPHAAGMTETVSVPA
jgi:hypothetical protein